MGPEDYNELKDLLVGNHNEVDMQEYNLGHLGLLIPKDSLSTDRLLQKIKAMTPEYIS